MELEIKYLSHFKILSYKHIHREFFFVTMELHVRLSSILQSDQRCFSDYKCFKIIKNSNPLSKFNMLMLSEYITIANYPRSIGKDALGAWEGKINGQTMCETFRKVQVHEFLSPETEVWQQREQRRMWVFELPLAPPF